jgi:hypothetical protein
VFSRCSSCGKIYWRGSHWEKMKKLAADALGRQFYCSGSERATARSTVSVRSLGPSDLAYPLML